ncbi:RHS repeat-associated protein [Chryseobacterium sp. H1D6B]|uniref:SpvB/TcaC N-terminal domain-containing protein n=1 Tax=Chryseobacterium sp. H1D6B TaxID=2940588 RepID=UPI0015C6AA02|nr:SpvB/TcaC N-terminal domain-containing protein [Chryseobacterium sp. H1D6B]MDH6252847.1 RHS repeat-associated protein [Chryseobacterium sp. H1D6B]
MKIKSKQLPFTKKSCLVVFFFACMFVSAGFTKEDRQRVREFKKDLMSRLIPEKAVPLDDNSEETPSSDKSSVKNDKVFPLGSNASMSNNIIGDSEGNKNEIEGSFNDHTAENSSVYSSKEKQGIIGTSSDKEEDRISDNFFTVDVPSVNKNTGVYLEYDLFGLASHESVPRSVNRNVSIGGEIVVPNASWTHQKEEISTDLIKNGLNTILFTSPAAGVKYKIRNLKIVFDNNKKSNHNLIVSSVLSGGKLYVKGNNVLSKDLNINNVHVAVKNGEFEKVIELSDQDKAKGSFSILNGGVYSTYKIPAAADAFKISNSSYADAKGIEISNDKEFNVNYENLSVKIEKETSESAFVEVLKLREKDFPAVSDGVKNITLNNAAYRFSVVSGKLNKKVKLTIPYDQNKLGLVSPKEIRVFHFDYTKKQWIVDKSAVLDEKAKTVTVESNGDNDYINGVISVPESPQTNSFAPTSISGLKAGDPTAAVQFVAPPSANQKGSANVSYPIVIPSGRKGMQPSLSIAYSSGNGNGWMGEGWDISGLSSISIDTRWGSPTFHPSQETELYSMNGEMLVYDGSYLPHRHNDIDETSGIFTTNKQLRTANLAGNKKVFFLRRNHDFTKIERYGADTKEYRWVVTGTDGTKTYYGGDENGVNEQSVVRTPSNHIVHWAVWKVEDANKNNIKYNYDNVVPGGFSGDNANLNNGKVFHIKSIIYTGKDGSDGLYSVDFERETSVTRQDISINAKHGVKRIEPYKLTKIVVKYQGEKIRGYTLSYGTGQFYKTILQSIIEEDKTGNTASQHILEYYDDLKETGRNFSADSDVNASIANAFPFLPASLTPSKIQANSGFEWGLNSRIPGIGISILWPTQNPFGHFQASGLFGFYKAEAKNAQNLIDFDGDGIQDIVYRKPNDGLYVSSGTFANGNLSFLSPKKIVNLQSNFSYTTTKTDTKGFDFGAKIFGIGYNRSLVWSVSRSTTPVYMTDANSDGLMDVVKDGEVWFNRLNSNNTPEMTKYSDQTENMVLVADAAVEHHESEPEEELPPSKISVVKVWVAPKGGYVKLTDNISIENVAGAKAVYSVEMMDPVANGMDIVRHGRLYMKTLTAGMPVQNVSISKLDDYFSQIQALPPANPNNHWGINKNENILVNAGSKIYIRLHKEPNNNFKVYSDPKIVYTDENGQELANTAEQELDGFNLNNQGPYSENFLLNNRTNAANFDSPGSVTVTVPAVSFPKTTDVIRFKVVKIDVNTDTESIVYSDTYPQQDVPFTIPGYTLNYTVNANEPIKLKFVVESDSHISFKNSNWNNIDIKYVSGTNTVNFKGVAEYPSYEVNVLENKVNLNQYNLPAGTHTFGVEVSKTTSFVNAAPNTFYYIVKKGNHVLAKRKVRVDNVAPYYLKEIDMLANNQPVNGNSPINFYTGNVQQQLIPTSEKISIIAYCDSEADFNYFRGFFSAGGFGYGGPFKIFSDNAATTVTVRATVVKHNLFNTKSLLYNNWGQFLYDENNDVIAGSAPNSFVLNPETSSDTYGRLINPKAIAATNLPNVNINYAACQSLPTQAEIAQCIANQVNQPTSPYQTGSFMLNPVISMTTKKVNNVEKWVGMGPEQYSMADSFKNDQETTDLFDPNGGNPDMPDTVVQGPVDTKMYAVDKKHYSRSKTTTNSGSFFVSIGNSESHLEGKGSIDLQNYMDLNGDGYPDIVYNDGAQITNSTGGLGGFQAPYTNAYITNSDSYQSSVSISYSPNSHKAVGRVKVNGESITTTLTDTSTSWSGVGLGANYNAKDSGESYWIDINGDGLTDRITGGGTSNMQYSLNMGYGLSAPEKFANIQTYASRPVGSGGLNFGTGAFSQITDFSSGASSGFGISGSLNISASLGTAEKVFEDINADGLIDILYVSSSSTSVSYNLGNKFAAPVQLSKGGGNVDFNNEAKTYNGGFSLNGSYYYNIPIVFALWIPIIYLKLGAEVSANVGLSIAEVDKAFKDMNGDGFPDLVISKNDGFKVNYSTIGKTNKLKSVASIYNRMPLNKFVINYEFTKPSYSDPSGRLVMSEVRVINTDVTSGSYLSPTTAKDMLTKIKYGTSRYDRRERDFFGFDTVTTEEWEGASSVYRSTRETFYNNSYFLNGVSKKTEMFGGTSNLLSVSDKIYKLYKFKNNNTQIDQSVALSESFDTGGKEGRKMAKVLLSTTKNRIYENGGSVVTVADMNYNELGQLTGYKYQSPSSVYNTKITYHALSNNIINVPKTIDVYVGGSGTASRHRETVADNITGNIEKFIVKLNASENAETALKYDSYGNISQITYPPNEATQRYSLTYQYDTVLNKYLVEVIDNFDVKSSSHYDPMFDSVIDATDTSGNKILYKYDARGRITSVLAPYEAENSIPYTIEYEYFMAPFASYNNNESRFLYGAVTRNYDSQNPQNPIETISLSDGLGRVVQVKKDIDLADKEKMSVSGMAIYDVHGRVVKQYHPIYEDKDSSPINANNVNAKINLNFSGYFNTTVFDVSDRVISQTDEDGHSTSMEFSIAGNVMKTTTAQMQNNSVQLKSETLKNTEGKTVQNNNYVDGQVLETFYNYDLIGQLTSVIDPEVIITSYDYDMAGRRIKLIHPDHGVTAYEYDKAGNLIKMFTANLKNDPAILSPYIKYDYSYNRLIGIEYPSLANGYSNPSNVRYLYGATGTGNATAKLIRKYDSTGDTQYKYGKMGEIVEENKSILPYNAPPMNFVTKYAYDSWNRLQRLTYPDQETVKYEYNLGGSLKRIYNTEGYEYVKRIDYDEYEQRTSIEYGNDTRSDFSYLPSSRMLNYHMLKDNGGNDLLNNFYAYDFVGNITELVNKAPKSPNEMGGNYNYRYSYDELNRLKKSGGEFGAKDPTPYTNSQANYELALDYNLSGGINTKRQDHNQDSSVNFLNTYENTYKYLDGTHMVSSIYDPYSGNFDEFRYDFNGNTVLNSSSVGGEKLMFWDEQDRLKAYYAPEQGVYQYYSYDDKGERIIKYNLKEQPNLYQNGALINSGLTIDAYKLYPNAYLSLTSNKRYTKHYYAGSQRIASKVVAGTDAFIMDSTEYKVKGDQEKKIDPEVDFNTYTKKAGLDISEIKLELAKNSPVMMPDIYYIHTDHLGTGTFVTNSNAETTQFFLNLPFGETMVEQMTNVYDNPYKFNAKELDAETGFYYYGARYYNPKWSVWYGVDPLAVYNPVMEKQFYGDGDHNGGVFNLGNLNPYIYTYQNPIRYIDPNGKQVDAVVAGIKKMWHGVNPWAATENTADGLRVRSSQERFQEFRSGSIQAAKGTATREVGHAVLDVIGTAEPTPFADGTNALWYLTEGNFKDAGFSAMALLPYLGDSGKGLKYLGKMAEFGPELSYFKVPKFYSYTTGKGSFFISPHAFKHLEELTGRVKHIGARYTELIGDIWVSSINTAIDDVVKKTGGKIEFDKMYKSGGNEIMFGAPRKAGELPAVKHFQPVH